MGLVVILASTVVAMSAVAQLWEDEWEVLLISLQVSEVAGDRDNTSPEPLQQAGPLSLLFLHSKVQRSWGGGVQAHSRTPSDLSW